MRTLHIDLCDVYRAKGRITKGIKKILNNLNGKKHLNNPISALLHEGEDRLQVTRAVKTGDYSAMRLYAIFAGISAMLLWLSKISHYYARIYTISSQLSPPQVEGDFPKCS